MAAAHVWGHGLRGVIALCFGAVVFAPAASHARPNTHGPSISTWDARASSVVLGLTRAVSGTGAFSALSYNANFSSTNGVLSAQFGVHYLTYQNAEGAPVARGASAGGVALLSLPLSDRFENGVPRSSFAFYIGGVPTALYAGEENFVSVPLVLGVGVPFSPTPFITLRPWVELSPGLNFDTRIDVNAVSTDDAIQSAMDGTLTREEVEGLIEQGLDIQRETTLGRRAGLSASAHLGKRVDLDVSMMLGAGRPGALSLGAALVVRWDTLVHELGRGQRAPASEPAEAQSCAALAASYHRSCPRQRPPTNSARPGASRRPAARHPARSTGSAAPARPVAAPSPVTPPAPWASPPSPAPAASGTPSAKPATTRPSAGPPSTPAPAPARPSADELPPLQAAPPVTP